MTSQQLEHVLGKYLISDKPMTAVDAALPASARTGSFWRAILITRRRRRLR
jgi:hypothetical protein